MTKRSTLAKGVVALAAGAMALSAAATAAAQPYGQYGYNTQGYDACQRDASGRGVGGALVGGAIGATVGSQISARGHRTDGSVVGGLLGALVGAGVGNSTAACTGSARAPNAYYNGAYPQQQYGYAQPYGQAYGQPYGGFNDQRSYYNAPRRAYRDGARFAQNDYAYGRGGERFRMAQGQVGPDGCALAESPIHMPDGRVQTRFVRVCMDSTGRYQVVD